MAAKVYRDFRSIAEDRLVGMPQFRDSYSEGINISKVQKQFENRLTAVRSLEPTRGMTVVVMLWSGPSYKPWEPDCNVFPADQVRLTLLIPMNRLNSFEPEVPSALEDDPEHYVPPVRYHFQQVEGRPIQGDFVFGGNGSLLGCKDLGRLPRAEWDVDGSLSREMEQYCDFLWRDTICASDNYTINIAMATMRAMEVFGPNSPANTHDPSKWMPRRLVEMANDSFLSAWEPNDLFRADPEVGRDFGAHAEEGITPDDREAAIAVLDHRFIIRAGSSGYDGGETGDCVLVDWRFLSEELRHCATGSEWVDFRHMASIVPPQESIGSGFVVVTANGGRTGTLNPTEYCELHLTNTGLEYDLVNGYGINVDPVFDLTDIDQFRYRHSARYLRNSYNGHPAGLKLAGA